MTGDVQMIETSLTKSIRTRRWLLHFGVAFKARDARERELSEELGSNPALTLHSRAPVMLRGPE